MAFLIVVHVNVYTANLTFAFSLWQDFVLKYHNNNIVKTSSKSAIHFHLITFVFSLITSQVSDQNFESYKAWSSYFSFLVACFLFSPNFSIKSYFFLDGWKHFEILEIKLSEKVIKSSKNETLIMSKRHSLKSLGDNEHWYCL